MSDIEDDHYRGKSPRTLVLSGPELTLLDSSMTWRMNRAMRPKSRAVADLPVAAACALLRNLGPRGRRSGQFRTAGRRQIRHSSRGQARDSNLQPPVWRPVRLVCHALQRCSSLPYEEAFAVTAGRGVRHARARPGAVPCHVPRGALGIVPEVLRRRHWRTSVFQAHGCRRSWDHSRVTPAPTHAFPPDCRHAPSATLAVDAKAKALRAANPSSASALREPDPTPDTSIEAAIAAAKVDQYKLPASCRSCAVHRPPDAARLRLRVLPDDILVTRPSERREGCLPRLSSLLVH